MSKNQSTAAPVCDDDVAGLFMRLGDGKGRPGYRMFPANALPQPAVATASATPAPTSAVAPTMPRQERELPATDANALPPSDTPLLQMFRKLAECGGAITDDSPLNRLRKQ